MEKANVKNAKNESPRVKAFKKWFFDDDGFLLIYFIVVPSLIYYLLWHFYIIYFLFYIGLPILIAGLLFNLFFALFK